MQALRKKVNVAKNRGRRDTVSDGVFPCQFCPGKEARLRVIRNHLMAVHKHWSFLKCNELEEDGETCEWFCHNGLRCFLNHAESFHQNFYNGKETKLSEETSFSLEICSMEERTTTHSETCKEFKKVNKKCNRRIWKKRESLEDLIHQKFVKGNNATDFSEKVKYYKEGFFQYKKLLSDYPRRHNRGFENTTLRTKNFEFHLSEFARVMKIAKAQNL